MSVLIILLALVSVSANAQETSQDKLSALRAQIEKHGASVTDDSEAGSLSAEYSAGRMVAYNDWTLDYAQEAYAWHHLSTVMIFAVVVIVVLSGVALAAWQLNAWLKRIAAYDAILLRKLEAGESVDRELVTEVGRTEASTVSVEERALSVSSPYVGVAILGISMGFFLAYLLFVYPVTLGV